MSVFDTPDSNDSLIRELARAPRRKLEDLKTDPLTGTDTHAASAAALPALGDTIDGRYVLESVLGSGGMGIVFAARNLHTGKEVALKYLSVLPGERTFSKRRAARFLREARAAGRVRHPNVVDMIDVGGGDGTHPYLVMERLRGKSLHARMQEGPLPATDAVVVMLSAMRGVAEAHRQGVIHRDIKPENIFLSEESTGVVPKVLDFGVSRITEGSGDPRPATLTQAGNVIGTPSYMPLEQLRGKTDVDARADVYSLGVVLYELLSGRRPFEAQNAHDLAIKMATEMPARLTLHTGRTNVALERVLMRALSRRPEDRYPNVETFAAELARCHAKPRPSARSIVWAIAGFALVAGGYWWLESAPAQPRVGAGGALTEPAGPTHMAQNNEAPASTVPVQTESAVVEQASLAVKLAGTSEQASPPALAPVRAIRKAHRLKVTEGADATRNVATPATSFPDPIERAKALRVDDF